MSENVAPDRQPLTRSDGLGCQPDGEPHKDAITGWTARLLDQTLRTFDGGPRPFYRAAVVSLAATSMLAIAIAALTRPQGSLPETQRHLIAGALAALGMSAALGLAPASRFRPWAWLDHVVAPRDRAAIWLALAVWFPFLLLVVYYRARATFPPPARYLYFPYDDKRWETIAYLLGVIAPAILLTAAARVLIVGRRKPPTWRAWFTGMFLESQC